MSKKIQYEMEFIFKASPNILFTALTSPSGLAQWFAEDVDIKDGFYIFSWSGSEEHARILEKEENEFIRLQWEDSEDDEFFEFRLERSEVTGDTILFITDFAEENELDDQKMLWASQIDDLKIRVGG